MEQYQWFFHSGIMSMVHSGTRSKIDINPLWNWSEKFRQTAVHCKLIINEYLC